MKCDNMKDHLFKGNHLKYIIHTIKHVKSNNKKNYLINLYKKEIQKSKLISQDLINKLIMELK